MRSAIFIREKKILIFLAIYSLIFLFFITNNYNSIIQADLHNGFTDITVSEAYALIENTTNLLILDVRTQDEYSVGHINNSYLLPYTEILSRQEELPENLSQPILVYCRSGRRSEIASTTLVELNFTTVYNMLDGFTEWLEAHYPYETSNTNPNKDLTTLFLVIIIISTLGFVVIVIGGIILSNKNKKI